MAVSLVQRQSLKERDNCESPRSYLAAVAGSSPSTTASTTASSGTSRAPSTLSWLRVLAPPVNVSRCSLLCPVLPWPALCCALLACPTLCCTLLPCPALRCPLRCSLLCCPNLRCTLPPRRALRWMPAGWPPACGALACWPPSCGLLPLRESDMAPRPPLSEADGSPPPASWLAAGLRPLLGWGPPALPACQSLCVPPLRPALRPALKLLPRPPQGPEPPPPPEGSETWILLVLRVIALGRAAAPRSATQTHQSSRAVLKSPQLRGLRQRPQKQLVAL